MSLAIAEMTNPLADLSPAIIAMLRDEANLVTARHVLEEARQDCLSRQEAIEAQRPALGFLGTQKKRDDYAASLATVAAQLKAIETMLARANGARERLQSPLRMALAEHFSQIDPLYRKGLRAGRYHEHWRRAHSIVADRLKAFMRDTREARTSLANDIHRARARLSSDSTWRLNIAHTAAAELDREIENLNRIVTEHAVAVTGTPFAEIRLPSIEAWNCLTKIDSVIVVAPPDGLAEIDHILADFNEYKQPTLQTLNTMFVAIAGEHAQMAERHLRSRWSQLLTYAEAHLVTDADLESTLSDIERRQIELERVRVAAQLSVTKPFSYER